MNDQNPINSAPAPVSAFDKPPERATWQIILEKLKPLPKILWEKFYTNKKVFWPVAIAFGLIFLVLLIGLIFGKRGTKTPVTVKPTATPFIAATPVASPSAGILYDSQQKLNSLKVQIDNLDPKQSVLQPPPINFEIRF